MEPREAVLKRIDDIAALVEELREQVAGEEVESLGAPGGATRDEIVLRQLRFLRPFYEAPGLSLSVDRVREIALEVGYDPRGTAGFYVGRNASLTSVGEMRVLTAIGKAWYETHQHLLDDEPDDDF